ncbi:MAG: isoprenylcysteine carboxylmethyltransferase family protein [Calditrichaeota bacterium]|nr:MAG: isoprenylcysteine carboxylmethyltransferase family protein [Calditrichota bacterium]
MTDRVGTRPSPASLLLVAVQMGCLAYLLYSGPLWPAQPGATTLVVLGLLLGLWALVSLSSARLNVFPEPRSGSRLVQHGPYRWIRHPMYTSVLLCALGWLSGHFTPGRAATFFILLVDLLLKIRREEALLARQFPEYRRYQQRTRRLVPGVY